MKISHNIIRRSKQQQGNMFVNGLKKIVTSTILVPLLLLLLVSSSSSFTKTTKSAVFVVHAQQQPYDDGYYNDGDPSNNGGVDGYYDYANPATPGGGEDGNEYYNNYEGNDPSGSNSGSGADSLYHDYAARLEQKEIGGAPNNNNAGMTTWFGTVTRLGCGTVFGWVIGSKYHTKKLSKKLYEQYKKEQKILYQQYYNDVYTLQQQNNELINALEQYIEYTTTGTKPTTQVGGGNSNSKPGSGGKYLSS